MNLRLSGGLITQDEGLHSYMAGATTRVLTIAVQEIEELLRPSLRLGVRVEPANNLVAFPDSIRLAASLAIIDNLDLTWL